MQALSEERDARFATVEEFGGALDRALVGARPRPRDRRMIPAVGVAGLALIGLGVAAVSWKRDSKPADERKPAATQLPPGSAGPLAPAPPAADFTNSLGMDMVLIPSGAFAMGTPPGEPDGRDEEWPAHRVQITRTFYLARCEVTFAQFRKFVEATGYRTDAERSGKGGHVFDNQKKALVQHLDRNFRKPRDDRPPDDNEPVVQVTYNDARAFCRWLGEVERRPYRLPTEAEWEYACRAGTTTRWSGGNNPDVLDDIAWTLRNSGLRLHPVGLKKPNAFGLCDMHGNAWEWCEDWYGPYSVESATDPAGPTGGAKKVLRGGSWDFGDLARTRSASRMSDPPDRAHFTHGFRIAADVPERVEVGRSGP